MREGLFVPREREYHGRAGVSKEKAGGKRQRFRMRGDFKTAPGTASVHPIYVGLNKRVGGVLNHLLSARVLLGLQWSQALVAMTAIILCETADSPGGKRRSSSQRQKLCYRI